MSNVVPLATAVGENAPSYANLLAASAAVLAYCRQRHLLPYARTERLTVVGSEYIGLPAPAVDIDRIAIASRGAIVPFNATAAEALAVSGVRLAVEQTTLTVGEAGESMLAGSALTYRQESDSVLRLIPPVARGSLALIDGRFGWGHRAAAHGHGWPSALGAADDSILWPAGVALPAIGTVLQWDREVIAVDAIVPGEPDTEVHLVRALGGTEDVIHESSTTAYTVTPDAGLASAVRTVAKRLATQEGAPGYGTAFDADGDPTPNLMRNMERALALYRARV